jgi:LCP family protein required for cell wall assembly
MGKYPRNVSKLNEMTSYGGMENIKDLTINQIENMLSIAIDNYVIVDLDAFKQIVDAVGGVDMDVPQRLYYVDRSGGLYIDLQKGMQHLDGDKAEQLVRFRSYPQGDVARVEVQQVFLKAFADKIMSPSIITKIPQLISILFDTVETDVNLVDAIKYSGYLNKLNSDNLSFHTLPGVGAYEGAVSYYFPDMDKVGDFINEVFYDTVPATEEDTETTTQMIEDKTVSIQVLNGSGTAGAAARAKDEIEQRGYRVSNIGNYESNDIEITLIYAKDQLKAEQFKTLYPNAKIEQKSGLEYDVQIILGKTN